MSELECRGLLDIQSEFGSPEQFALGRAVTSGSGENRVILSAWAASRAVSSVSAASCGVQVRAVTHRMTQSCGADWQGSDRFDPEDRTS